MLFFVTMSETKKRRDDSRRLFKLFWSGLLFVAIATTAAFATFAALTAATPTHTAFSTLATTTVTAAAAGALGHRLAQCVALGLVEFAVIVLIEFLHQAFAGRTAAISVAVASTARALETLPQCLLAFTALFLGDLACLEIFLNLLCGNLVALAQTFADTTGGAISVAVASTARALGETLPQCLLAFTGLCFGNLAGLEIFLNLLGSDLVALAQAFADAAGGTVCGAATAAAYCLAGSCALCITQFAIAILVESLDNGLTGGSISTSIRLFAGSLLGRSLVGCGLLSLSCVQADAEQKCNSKGFYCFNFHDVYFFLFSLPTSSMTEKLNAARE